MGSTWVNTYGNGIKEDLDLVGYYIDGVQRAPFVYSTTDNKFYDIDHVYTKGTRTLLNDINSSNQVAVEYRDSTGYMHSTIGLYDPVSHSIVYHDTFPLNEYQQTYIKGINNNGYIVAI